MTAKVSMAIAAAFPRSQWHSPRDGIMELVDANGEIIGNYDWNRDKFIVYDNYTYAKQAMQAIESELGAEYIDARLYDSETDIHRPAEKGRSSGSWSTQFPP